MSLCLDLFGGSFASSLAKAQALWSPTRSSVSDPCYHPFSSPTALTHSASFSLASVLFLGYDDTLLPQGLLPLSSLPATHTDTQVHPDNHVNHPLASFQSLLYCYPIIGYNSPGPPATLSKSSMFPTFPILLSPRSLLGYFPV